MGEKNRAKVYKIKVEFFETCFDILPLLCGSFNQKQQKKVSMKL